MVTTIAKMAAMKNIAVSEMLFPFHACAARVLVYLCVCVYDTHAQIGSWGGRITYIHRGNQANDICFEPTNVSHSEHEVRCLYKYETSRPVSLSL